MMCVVFLFYCGIGRPCPSKQEEGGDAVRVPKGPSKNDDLGDGRRGAAKQRKKKKRRLVLSDGEDDEDVRMGEVNCKNEGTQQVEEKRVADSEKDPHTKSDMDQGNCPEGRTGNGLDSTPQDESEGAVAKRSLSSMAVDNDDDDTHRRVLENDSGNVSGTDLEVDPVKPAPYELPTAEQTERERELASLLEATYDLTERFSAADAIGGVCMGRGFEGAGSPPAQGGEHFVTVAGRPWPRGDSRVISG